MRMSVATATLLIVIAGCDSAPPAPMPDASSPACASSAECDDGLFCSGVETCVAGECACAMFSRATALLAASAMRAAPASSVSGRMMANSSPPYRATVPTERAAR